MRGRKPHSLTIAAADRPILDGVARHRHLCWFQVQHARILLAVAAGEPISVVAARLECDRSTVWRVCRRYERGGLKPLLLDEPRVGRPPEISPPPAGPDRRAGVPGTDRRGVAHHPLDERGLGPPSGRRRHRNEDQLPHGPACPAGRGLAATPDPLLANHSARCPLPGASREGALVLRECGPAGPSGRLGGRGG
jgi:Winged helix-turn helix